MRIEKPWGYEEILEKNEFYVIKRIFVKKGNRLSKQYHEKKTETWIYPNGNIGMCPYEDRQIEEFSLGNIMKEHILDIFYSEKRMNVIKNIENNVYKDYPCNNPRLCGFGDGIEAK